MLDIWYLLENNQFMDTHHIVLINFIHLTDSSKRILVHYIEENYSIKFTSDIWKSPFIVMATISCQVKEYWRKPRIFNICWLIYHLSDICRITKKIKSYAKFCILKGSYFLVLIATVIWDAMVRKEINKNHKNRITR